MIYQIAYVSLSKTLFEEALLSDILTVSKRNNTRDGISGVLMYHNQLFFQILEGERNRVKNCYARILRDPRHSSISLMWEGEAVTRAFTSWAMGYAGPDEIGLHSGHRLASLADLSSAKDATTSSKNLALQMALQMFRNFSDVDRFGQSVSTTKSESDRRTSCRAETRQAFLTNAAKFADKGSKIDVTALAQTKVIRMSVSN